MVGRLPPIQKKYDSFLCGRWWSMQHACSALAILFSAARRLLDTSNLCRNWYNIWELNGCAICLVDGWIVRADAGRSYLVRAGGGRRLLEKTDFFIQKWFFHYENISLPLHHHCTMNWPIRIRLEYLSLERGIDRMLLAWLDLAPSPLLLLCLHCSSFTNSCSLHGHGEC